MVMKSNQQVAGASCVFRILAALYCRTFAVYLPLDDTTVNLSVAFLFIVALAMIGVGVNSIRTGEIPARFGMVVPRSRWPLRFWLGVAAYVGTGSFVLYEALRRVV